MTKKNGINMWKIAVGVAIIILVIVLISNFDNGKNKSNSINQNCHYENVIKTAESNAEWVFIGRSQGWDDEKKVVGSCIECFRDLDYTVKVTNSQDDTLKYKVSVIFAEGEIPQEKTFELIPGEIKEFNFIKGDFVYVNEFGSLSYGIWDTNVYYFDDTSRQYATQEYVCN